MVSLYGYSRGLLILVMLGIACLDYVTGKSLSVWGLYLIPITLGSWLGGFRLGVLLSVTSSILILVVGLIGGNAYASTGYFLIQIFNRFTSFFLVSWLASHLLRKQMLESTIKSYEEYLDYLLASPKSQQQDIDVHDVAKNDCSLAHRHIKQET